MKFDIAPSCTLWHITTRGKTTPGARYRVDYIFSLHRVYCAELRAYGWRLIIGRLRFTWEAKAKKRDDNAG
jgi:hypothetical protein